MKLSNEEKAMMEEIKNLEARQKAIADKLKKSKEATIELKESTYDGEPEWDISDIISRGKEFSSREADKKKEIKAINKKYELMEAESAKYAQGLLRWLHKILDGVELDNGDYCIDALECMEYDVSEFELGKKECVFYWEPTIGCMGPEYGTEIKISTEIFSWPVSKIVAYAKAKKLGSYVSIDNEVEGYY